MATNSFFQIIILPFCRLVNESLQMLARYPELNTKILPLMEDYLVALRSTFVIVVVVTVHDGCHKGVPDPL